MMSDRTTDPAGTVRDTNAKIKDLPTSDAGAEKVKGGIGPVDGKTKPKPYGPVDG